MADPANYPPQMSGWPDDALLVRSSRHLIEPALRLLTELSLTGTLGRSGARPSGAPASGLLRCVVTRATRSRVDRHGQQSEDCFHEALVASSLLVVDGCILQ